MKAPVTSYFAKKKVFLMLFCLFVSGQRQSAGVCERYPWNQKEALSPGPCHKPAVWNQALTALAIKYNIRL